MVTRADYNDIGRLVLRLAVAGLMLFHGISKLDGGIGGIERMLGKKGLPELLAYGVYVGEVLAPLMIIIGFRTRLAALLLGFNMVMAIWLAHAGDIFEIGRHGQWAIELQMFYLLGALAIFFLGAGRYSVSGGQGVWD